MNNKFYFLLINFIKFLIKLIIPKFIRGKLSFVVEVDNFEEISKKIIKKNKVIIFDVGSNEGQSIYKFKKNFKNCEIHAFEPMKEAFFIMSEKFKKFENITLNQFALGEKIQERYLYENNIFSEISSFYKINKSKKKLRSSSIKNLVKIKTIDNYCKKKKIKFIDYLKIDVQGFEKNVLSGAKGMLRNNKIKLIEVEIIFQNFYENVSSFYDIEEILHKYNYRLYNLKSITYDKNQKLNQLDALFINENLKQ